MAFGRSVRPPAFMIKLSSEKCKEQKRNLLDFFSLLSKTCLAILSMSWKSCPSCRSHSFILSNEFGKQCSLISWPLCSRPGVNLQPVIQQTGMFALPVGKAGVLASPRRGQALPCSPCRGGSAGESPLIVMRVDNKCRSSEPHRLLAGYRSRSKTTGP